MNASTRVFIVLLRLAIGWQLIIAANDKFTPEWTSEKYLRKAEGPAAPFFHYIAGDTLRDRLNTGDGKTFPAALEQDWQLYFDRFANHYDLDESQRKLAEVLFQQQQKQTLRWLTEEKVPVEKKPPKGDAYTRSKTVPEWLKELDAADEAVDLPASEYHWEAREDYAKNWHGQLRAALKSGLDQHTKTLKTDLQMKVKLTDAQRKLGPVRDEPLYPFDTPLSTWAPPGSPLSWTRLQWADFTVKWGLWLAGAGLLVGLFTRTSAVIGAMLLLSFVLAMPPLPGLTAAAATPQGRDLYINETVIQAIALLLIATTRSGRWLGLDGLVQFLCPRRWRRNVPPVV